MSRGVIFGLVLATGFGILNGKPKRLSGRPLAYSIDRHSHLWSGLQGAREAEAGASKVILSSFSKHVAAAKIRCRKENDAETSTSEEISAKSDKSSVNHTDAPTGSEPVAREKPASGSVGPAEPIEHAPKRVGQKAGSEDKVLPRT